MPSREKAPPTQRAVEHARRYLEQRFARAGVHPQMLGLPSSNVHCWVGGSGPPLVLLQGFGGPAIWQWAKQVPALARSFRVYVPDLLFFGESRPREAGHTLEHQADMVASASAGFAKCRKPSPP